MRRIIDIGDGERWRSKNDIGYDRIAVALED